MKTPAANKDTPPPYSTFDIVSLEKLLHHTNLRLIFFAVRNLAHIVAPPNSDTLPGKDYNPVMRHG